MSRYISNLHVCEIHVAYTVTFLDPNVLVYRVAVCLVYVGSEFTADFARAYA
eukprot:COSAG05_NODE_2010_length_3702_cov_5.469886_4_plen_52_part_00